MKNLLTSLQVVTELQNLAIRDRHWHQLMAATGVRLTMDKVSALFLIYCMYVCNTLLVPVCTAESFLTRRFLYKGLLNTVQFLPIIFAERFVLSFSFLKF